MAEETLKIVYFPEIPATDSVYNTENARIDGKTGILPGTVTASAFQHIRGENTAFGSSALLNIRPFGTTGYDLNQGRRNTMVGYQAGYNLKLGHDNVAIGKQALYSLES